MMTSNVPSTSRSNFLTSQLIQLAGQLPSDGSFDFRLARSGTRGMRGPDGGGRLGGREIGRREGRFSGGGQTSKWRYLRKREGKVTMWSCREREEGGGKERTDSPLLVDWEERNPLLETERQRKMATREEKRTENDVRVSEPLERRGGR